MAKDCFSRRSVYLSSRSISGRRDFYFLSPPSNCYSRAICWMCLCPLALQHSSSFHHDTVMMVAEECDFLLNKLLQPLWAAGGSGSWSGSDAHTFYIRFNFMATKCSLASKPAVEQARIANMYSVNEPTANLDYRLNRGTWTYISTDTEHVWELCNMTAVWTWWGRKRLLPLPSMQCFNAATQPDFLSVCYITSCCTNVISICYAKK